MGMEMFVCSCTCEGRDGMVVIGLVGPPNVLNNEYVMLMWSPDIEIHIWLTAWLSYAAAL